jgi:UDP-N-acetylmuramoylalanine--D-glutamate ligase
VTAFEGNVHLIAGGRDKMCDFSVVTDVLPTHVKQVVLIGEAAQRMQNEWKDFAPIVRAKTLDEAIEVVAAEAVSGDSVVFSPGCSSFDMFRNYEERGVVFMNTVRDIVPSIARARRDGDTA